MSEQLGGPARGAAPPPSRTMAHLRRMGMTTRLEAPSGHLRPLSKREVVPGRLWPGYLDWLFDRVGKKGATRKAYLSAVEEFNQSVVSPSSIDAGLSTDTGDFATGDPGVSPDRTLTGWLAQACRPVTSWPLLRSHGARTAGRTWIQAKDPRQVSTRVVS